MANKIKNKNNKPKAKPQKQRAQGRVTAKRTPGVAELSEFQLASFDPFAIRGARVPDGDIRPTYTTFTRWQLNHGRAIVNNTNSFAYVAVLHLPILSNAYNGTVFVGSTTSPTSSIFDYSANVAATTVDFTKTWGMVNSSLASEVGASLLNASSFRISGGGVKIVIADCTPTNQASVYSMPLFNRDDVTEYYDRMISYASHRFRISDNAEVVIPTPIRSTGDAYDWIPTTMDGSISQHYPYRDQTGMGAANVPGSFVVTNSTDCTAANSTSRLFCMQGGLGATWTWIKLPPGASFSVETIIHAEVNPMGGAANPYQASALTKVCLPNHAEIDKVVSTQSSYSQLTKSNIEVSGKVDPLSWITASKNALKNIEVNVNGVFDVARVAYPMAVQAQRIYNIGSTLYTANRSRRNPMISGP